MLFEEAHGSDLLAWLTAFECYRAGILPVAVASANLTGLAASAREKPHNSHRTCPGTSQNCKVCAFETDTAHKVKLT